MKNQYFAVVSLLITALALAAAPAEAMNGGRQFVPLVKSSQVTPLADGIASTPRVTNTGGRNFIPLDRGSRSGSTSRMISLNGGSSSKPIALQAVKETPRSEKPDLKHVDDQVKLAMLNGGRLPRAGMHHDKDEQEMIAEALAPLLKENVKPTTMANIAPLVTKEEVRDPELKNSKMPELAVGTAARLAMTAANAQGMSPLPVKLDNQSALPESMDITDEDLENDLEFPTAVAMGVIEHDTASAVKSRRDEGFVWPVDGDDYIRISSAFGARRHPVTGKQDFHAGIDIPAPVGTPVVAALEGEVSAIGTHKNLGRYVKVSHADGSYSIYGHLSAQTTRMGSHVKAGQRIGKVGSTGRSTGPHLDFSIRKGGKPINPMPLLADALQEKKLALAN